jgi:hypothetical protein
MNAWFPILWSEYRLPASAMAVDPSSASKISYCQFKKNPQHGAMGNIVIDNEQGFFIFHWYLSFSHQVFYEK